MILHGDCLEKLKELADNSVDSIVTDPPYELGFMGKKWDNTGIANDKNMWAECLMVLKPGGHLLAFSGTRTYHIMASAIEDAGFEVRDMIEWVYGSGFPKSLNIGKAVDKLQGNEREVVGVKKSPDGRDYSIESACQKGEFGGENAFKKSGMNMNKLILTKGTSEWEGWGTALKPAHEPICMARKPLSEKTVVENCLKWGTGGIDIDGSRVGTEVTTTVRNSNSGGERYGRDERTGSWQNPPGRFPSNLIHDNSEEVRECFPNESERFFKSIIYQAKASKSERNRGCDGLEEKVSGGMAGTADQTLLTGSGNIRNNMARNNHPTVKPIALMEYLIKMVTRKGGTVLDPFMGSGSTGVACKRLGYEFIGIEREAEYITIAKARIESAEIIPDITNNIRPVCEPNLFD